MMPTAHESIAALPRLADAIPFEYRVPGGSGICGPLALALLRTPAMGDEMFSLTPNALLVDVFADLNERDLATRAVTRWWSGLQQKYPMALFKWQLTISDMQDLHDRYERPALPGDRSWFCISRNENFDIPRVSLARAVEALEISLEGFGQTVIAVLQDAVRHLPECFTPWLAHRAAEWLYWSESENDEEMLALARENGEDPADALTRAKFFEQMPQWVVIPDRTRSRDEIVRAAREGFEHQVIAACDAISALASRKDFSVRSDQCGSETAGYDSVDGMAVIAWREFDTAGGIIDDMLNHIGQSGEYVHFIDMQHIELTPKAVAGWMRRTEDMVHLAHLTEKLINLIGEPF